MYKVKWERIGKVAYYGRRWTVFLDQYGHIIELFIYRHTRRRLRQYLIRTVSDFATVSKVDSGERELFWRVLGPALRREGLE